jgi:RND family efflux transporter MFP subunit
MADTGRSRVKSRGKHWWTAFGATIVFSLIGVLLAPGLARREPTTLPRSAPPELPPDVELPAGIPPSEDAATDRASAAAPLEHGAAMETPAFDCMIMPSEVVEIGSSVVGLIDAVTVERGDYVETGEVVAQLESSVEQAAVDVARARARRRGELDSSKVSLELGERRRQRAVNLFERNSLSLDTRQEVETEATLAALELERAKENRRIASLQLDQAIAVLRRHTIRSPISGFVTERLMAPGEVVDEETILRIAQVDPLRVEVILPSQWFGRVHPGDLAEIVPEAPLDEVRKAEVAIVDPLIDGPSGTFGARLLLPNPDHDLPAGLRCQVSFVDPD